MKTLFDNGYSIKDILNILSTFDKSIAFCKKNNMDFVTHISENRIMRFEEFYELFTAYKTLAN